MAIIKDLVDIGKSLQQISQQIFDLNNENYRLMQRMHYVEEENQKLHKKFDELETMFKTARKGWTRW